MDINKFKKFNDLIVSNCSKVIVGKKDEITKIIICFICSGHILLDDVPGTGKTMLFRSFAKSIGANFKRIQFTPDVMPSDVTGINFYNVKKGEFEFRKGPIFTNLVLADEINRATPRTQSSLLEAMAENQVSVDGTTYKLEQPFMVAATQNPVESYGTFPLPEAQMDRFMMRLSLGYMKKEEEKEVIKRDSSLEILNRLECVVDQDDIIELKKTYRNVYIDDEIIDYIMNIVDATRNHQDIILGASTRGAIALYQASQVKAALSGRDYVIPEDVKDLAASIIMHRLSFRGVTSYENSLKIFNSLLNDITVPVENTEK